MRLSRGFVKGCSFAHSSVYLALLIVWLIPGLHPFEMVFGFAHGIGWFFMVALALVAARMKVIDLRLASCIAVLGAIGPFIGTAEFVRQDREAADGGDDPTARPTPATTRAVPADAER